ncbi:MAG: hypothetical protein RMK92_03530 [Armatimonadota bacterium]|nr:hypothetical protein [Armatimonadota bacterium]
MGEGIARRGVLILLGVLAMSAQAQRFALDVVPGFDGVCPSEGCYPVTVFIQGQRASSTPAIAEVQVDANSWTGSTSARKRVTLSDGLVSQSVSLLLCSPEEPNEIVARLVVGGRVLATSKPVSVTMAQWYPLLVGLGTDSSAVAFLPQRSLEAVSVEGMLVPAADASRLRAPFLPFPSGEQSRRLFLGRVRSSLPPESALAYRGVAAVSLDDRAWDTLNERQQQALIGYLWSGGLVIVHGVDLNRLQSLAPSGVLPVEPLGVTQVPASALASWVSSLRGAAGTVAVVRSRPLGGATTLLRYGDVPLVVVASRGLGQVVFLAFDPTQPPLADEQAAHALWKRILQLQRGRFVPPPMMFSQGSHFSWGMSEPTGRAFYSQLVQALVDAVAAKPVPLTWLLAYLGVYIFVLMPANYLVLRQIDRLHLSWFTLPLLAVLTSVAGYVVATRVQTSSHQMRQWTAIYAAAGSPQATVESDWVLYSAHTQRYRLQAKVDGTIVENSPSELQARRIGETPQEEPADLRSVLIPLWSARSFHLSGRTSLPGTVNVSAERRVGSLRLTVHNNTPYTLKQLHLVTALGAIPLQGTCEPGTQKEFQVRHGALLLMPAIPAAPPPFGTFAPASEVDGREGERWREEAQRNWHGIVYTRLGGIASKGSPRTPPRPLAREALPSINLSRAVLVAEVEGFPQVVEVSPASASTQQVTVLAVSFGAGGEAR